MAFFKRLAPVTKTVLTRDEPSGPVGPEEIERAKVYLRKNVGFDVDGFLARRSASSIFEDPLGATPVCLSINDVAAFVEDSDLSLEKRAHLSECDGCRRSVATYRRAVTDDWNPVTGSIRIEDRRHILIPETGAFTLTLANYSPEKVFAQLDPETFTISGAIEARGCKIESRILGDVLPLEAFDSVCSAGIALDEAQCILDVRDDAALEVLTVEDVDLVRPLGQQAGHVRLQKEVPHVFGDAGAAGSDHQCGDAPRLVLRRRQRLRRDLHRPD